MSRIRVATVAGDIDLEATVAEALGFLDDVELVLRCLDKVEFLAAIRGGHLDALVVIEEPPWLDRQCVAEAMQQGVGAVAIADSCTYIDPSAVLGRDAHISSVVAACEKAPAMIAPVTSGSGSGGRVTAVWGPKGAPGRTRVAIELAAVLSGGGSSTILVDADPYGGDVLQALGVIDEMPTIVWACRMAAKGELDMESLSSNLRSVQEGPVTLPGLPRADLWADVSHFGFSELLGVLRGSFERLVVDVGFCLEPALDPYGEGAEGRNRMARAAVAEADHVVAVCRADPIGIKNFLWAYESLRPLVSPERVVIVVNRVSNGSEREISRLLYDHLGKRPAAYLPDRPDVMAAAAASNSVVAKVKGSADMRASLDALAIAVGARLRPRGLMASLGGRR